MPLNEAEIIKRYFQRPVSDSGVITGIGDDAAVLQAEAGQQLVVTTDTMIEDHHFFREMNPKDLAYKILAINLSDIAAMGATPRWATINLTLSEIDASWMRAFSEGFFELADRYSISLVGGDTCRGEKIAVSVQLIGIVDQDAAVRRSGASPNQSIYVTGSLGLAATDLIKSIKNHEQSININPIYLPKPRVEVGVRLRPIATSMTDISDGLLLDLQNICRSSEVGAVICLDQLPINHEVADSEVLLESALTGGEDYELLFTCDPKHTDCIHSIAAETECAITHIGETVVIEKCSEGNLIQCTYHGKMVPLPKMLGFDHFAASA